MKKCLLDDINKPAIHIYSFYPLSITWKWAHTRCSCELNWIRSDLIQLSYQRSSSLSLTLGYWSDLKSGLRMSLSPGFFFSPGFPRCSPFPSDPVYDFSRSILGRIKKMWQNWIDHSHQVLICSLKPRVIHVAHIYRHNVIATFYESSFFSETKHTQKKAHVCMCDQLSSNHKPESPARKCHNPGICTW